MVLSMLMLMYIDGLGAMSLGMKVQSLTFSWYSMNGLVWMVKGAKVWFGHP